mmetsp:Transcript_315/g.795  ORF Transcript_315/g.795 Transcript_315/m.795 type:complete len:214 (-) Transcript_315:291-932(-)
MTKCRLAPATPRAGGWPVACWHRLGSSCGTLMRATTPAWVRTACCQQPTCSSCHHLPGPPAGASPACGASLPTSLTRCRWTAGPHPHMRQARPPRPAMTTRWQPPCPAPSTASGCVSRRSRAGSLRCSQQQPQPQLCPHPTRRPVSTLTPCCRPGLSLARPLGAATCQAAAMPTKASSGCCPSSQDWVQPPLALLAAHHPAGTTWALPAPHPH